MALRILQEVGDTVLTEDDVPGASLSTRNPEQLKNEELRFWLRYRGDVGKGLKTKAEFSKEVTCYLHRSNYEKVTKKESSRLLAPLPYVEASCIFTVLSFVF